MDVYADVTFPANPTGNSVASVLLTDLPCSPTGYDCVTAEDELHTLVVKVTPVIVDQQYVVEFTGPMSMFFQADLYNDNLVDIVDFGVFVARMGLVWRREYAVWRDRPRVRTWMPAGIWTRRTTGSSRQTSSWSAIRIAAAIHYRHSRAPRSR